MVRFKNRWLLVTFAFDPYPASSSSSSSFSSLDPTLLSSSSSSPFPTPTLPPPLTAADITKLLRISLQFNFGDLGIGAHGGNAQCRYYSPALRTAIIRCARESAKVVWAAVTLITEHRGRRVRPRVIHVGGTIKKVQLRAMGLDRAAISNLQTVMAQTGPEIGDEDDLAANLQPPNSLDVLEDVGAPLDMALAVGPLSSPATGAGAGADANDNDDLGEPISSLGEVIPRDQFPPIT